jgi:RNA polymerase sigma-70 factor (ECF subfamily)
MTDRTDAQLLRDAAEPAAFAEVYRRHAPAVYSWLRRRFEWAAADPTADTFAQAWLARRCFRDQRDGSALPWLIVDAGSYQPIEWRVSLDGQTAVARFPTYERLPATPANAALLDLAAQHPGARVDNDPADFTAAEQRLARARKAG